MFTYDDLKNMRRGKEAVVDELSSQMAARKLQNIAKIENQHTQQIDDEALMADAQKIIDELHNNQDLDPDQVLKSLPPVLQKAVFELMGSNMSQPMGEEQSIVEEQPMGEEQPIVEEPLGVGNGSIDEIGAIDEDMQQQLEPPTIGVGARKL